MDPFLVGDKQLYDLRPGLVQCFVPYARREILFYLHLLALRVGIDLDPFGVDALFAVFEWDLVNFVHQHKNVRVLVELPDRPQRFLPVVQALAQTLTLLLYLKHVYQHLHAPEYRLLLHFEVLLHEGVLSATVPKV